MKGESLKMGQLEEIEFAGTPQNPFLGPAAQMLGDECQTGSEYRHGPVSPVQHKTENHFRVTGD